MAVTPDTCICPDCKAILDVDDNYGHHLRCSECGCKIDVFEDSTMFINTLFGKFAVSFLN